METKTFKVEQKNTLQYFLAIVLSVLLGLGLIPGNYDDVGVAIIVVLLIQILFSVVKFNFLHLLLELVILILALISFIPWLGYVFRILAFIFSLLDLVTFKNSAIYKQVNVRFDNSFSKKKESKQKKMKQKKEVQDANFTEK